MTLYKWSPTAATNGTADSSCPAPEGMAPSQVNDSMRGMMAAVAKYRDDHAGTITTGGTNTAFTVTSFQGFDTLANMHGKSIAFEPHATNGANGTSLNVDGLGVKPILVAPGVGLPGGVLVQGTPYMVVYNNTDAAFYVHGLFGNPYQIPIGAGIEYWGATLPNSNFAFPLGQAISRTTYATLFTMMGTTHGVGDGATTFNLPDPSGYVRVMKEAAAARLTATYFGGNSTLIGAKGGAESHALDGTQIPAHNHGTNVSDTRTWSVALGHSGLAANTGATGSGTDYLSGGPTAVTVSGGALSVTTNNTGGSLAHKIVQPTIIVNYMIRII